jgi:hypothetical protein
MQNQPVTTIVKNLKNPHQRKVVRALGEPRGALGNRVSDQTLMDRVRSS